MNNTGNISGSGASYPAKEVEENNADQVKAQIISQQQKAQRTQDDSKQDDVSAILNEYATFWKDQSPSDGAITNRVLMLLIALTETMQDVTVAQAHQLSNLGDLQKAYMQLKTEIPFLTKGQPGAPNDNYQRQDLNSEFSTYMENVRANEGLVQDKQKSVQSNMSASKDTSFSSIFDSLIDLNKRLVSQIFR